MSNWRNFSSEYFAVSFKVPAGFDVEDVQNKISVANGLFEGGEGFEGIFFQLVRYTELNKDQIVERYIKNHKDIKTSVVSVDNALFTRMDGVNTGDGLGESAIFFDKSTLYIRQTNDKTRDTISIGNQILSTFRFTK